MIRTRSLMALIMLFFGFVWGPLVYAQSPDTNLEDLKESALNVFLDCRDCDRDYFRENITYVNYVRDRQDADVHILVTQQRTGSGGGEYTFAFIGLEENEGLDHTLVYASGPTDTRDETRQGQLEILERGIFPYIVETPIAEYIFLDFKKRLEPTALKDPWKFWVFSISADGRLSGQEIQHSRTLEMNISANKVTPDIKIRLGLSADFDRRVYKYDDETIISISNEKDATLMMVKSLSDHWSVGGWVEAEASTFSNVDLDLTVTPALEYNFFPYPESTRRQLRFLYKIGWNYANYTEETIYEKMIEHLFKQSLTVTFEMRERWGSASTSLTGSHYFHDFKKNRLNLRGYVGFRIFRGFTVTIRGNYQLIHDQLSLPMGDLTLDELLLQRKELATGYNYSVSIGIRYTFGSVYSNVVNPRFGGVRYRGF